MKFVIHPSIEPQRLAVLKAEAPTAEWVNAADADAAVMRIAQITVRSDMIGSISISPADYGNLIAITATRTKRMRGLKNFFYAVGRASQSLDREEGE